MNVSMCSQNISKPLLKVESEYPPSPATRKVIFQSCSYIDLIMIQVDPTNVVCKKATFGLVWFSIPTSQIPACFPCGTLDVGQGVCASIAIGSI